MRKEPPCAPVVREVNAMTQELSFPSDTATLVSSSDEAAELLASRISAERTVLFVGAGSSAHVGYPCWKRLLELMRDRFAQGASLTENYVRDGQMIRDRITPEHERDYHQFIHHLFGPPRKGPGHKDFHELLCRLPICGIVTTNYDPVMESAVSACCSTTAKVTDLCHRDNYRFNLLEHIHTIASHAVGADVPRYVMHLHGTYEVPQNVILTRSDYVHYYGRERLRDESGHVADGTLDTIHRKVIWALLTNYHILFVGVALSDPYITEMLDIVRDDLDLGDRTPHTALVGIKEAATESGQTFAEQVGLKTKKWNRYGVKPLFFRVFPGHPEDDYLTDQQALLERAASALGVAYSPSPLSSVNQKMTARARHED